MSSHFFYTHKLKYTLNDIFLNLCIIYASQEKEKPLIYAAFSDKSGADGTTCFPVLCSSFPLFTALFRCISVLSFPQFSLYYHFVYHLCITKRRQGHCSWRSFMSFLISCFRYALVEVPSSFIFFR